LPISKDDSDAEVGINSVEDNASARVSQTQHLTNFSPFSDEQSDLFEVRTPEVDSDNNSFVSCEVADKSANSSSQSLVIDNAKPADEPSTQSLAIGEEG